MKSRYIVHIDYGSRGNSGFYIERILKASKAQKYVRAYVHSEFGISQSDAKIIRIFDRWSSLIKSSNIKAAVKVVDIYLCFFKIIFDIRALSKVYEVDLYCAFFQSFHVYSWFFKIIRKYCNLNVTVHDAIELKHNYPSFIMSDRDNTISHAHRLIIHSESSAEILKYLDIPMSIIRFPVTNRLISKNYTKDYPVKFLFIGHLRKEKGISSLIKAWSMLTATDFERGHLVIAGNDVLNLGKEAINLPNCVTKLNYIDDKEFEALIQATDYVILPYEGGTNSGILSEASSFGKPCITSDIPCFSQSEYFLEDLSVKNLDDLSYKISNVINKHIANYNNYVSFLESKNIDYQLGFNEDINQMYNSTLK